MRRTPCRSSRRGGMRRLKGTAAVQAHDVARIPRRIEEIDGSRDARPRMARRNEEIE
jgi:hypothetical protein